MKMKPFFYCSCAIEPGQDWFQMKRSAIKRYAPTLTIDAKTKTCVPFVG